MTNELINVGEHSWAYLQPHQGWCVSNSGVVSGERGNFIVDTLATESRTARFLSGAAQATGRDPVGAVNTHFHGDHTYGNWLLPRTCPIYASGSTADEARQSGLGLMQLWPDADWGEIRLRVAEEIIDSRTTVDLGNVVVDLIPTGLGHTSGDVIAWVPADGVLYAGDLVMADTTPFYLFGDLDGAESSLAFIKELDPAVVVPGHGPLLDGLKAVDEGFSYIAWLRQMCEKVQTDGVPPGDLASWLPACPFPDWAENERDPANVYAACLRAGIYQESLNMDLALSLMVQRSGGRGLHSCA